ncbi:hypothetical protein AB0P15_29195 [Streptomyces sp. NPDC087917]|uniref:hypothetical protein n=1 Tax=Streptomyces sp. NPDC087917 TaxID=3155060 RepID=UPI003439B649
MAPKREHLTFLRAARRLRRVRSLYTAGVLFWAGAAAWSGWLEPGSRQMWVCVLLLSVFTGLLITACLWLRRHSHVKFLASAASPRVAVTPGQPV